ncbi:hypothetical protein JOQ06_024760, partial [Pogonophryne albipinna]
MQNERGSEKEDTENDAFSTLGLFGTETLLTERGTFAQAFSVKGLQGVFCPPHGVRAGPPRAEVWRLQRACCRLGDKDLEQLLATTRRLENKGPVLALHLQKNMKVDLPVVMPVLLL